MENQSTQIFHPLKNYAHLMITLYLHNLHLITPTQKFTPAYFKTTHLKDHPDFFLFLDTSPLLNTSKTKITFTIRTHPFTHTRLPTPRYSYIKVNFMYFNKYEQYN